MARAQFTTVHKFLSGVNYPASKQKLVEHARSQKADKDAIEALEHIPRPGVPRPQPRQQGRRQALTRFPRPAGSTRHRPTCQVSERFRARFAGNVVHR
jgi:Protein of unknown function (DUF2795)